MNLNANGEVVFAILKLYFCFVVTSIVECMKRRYSITKSTSFPLFSSLPSPLWPRPSLDQRREGSPWPAVRNRDRWQAVAFRTLLGLHKHVYVLIYFNFSRFSRYFNCLRSVPSSMGSSCIDGAPSCMDIWRAYAICSSSVIAPRSSSSPPDGAACSGPFWDRFSSSSSSSNGVYTSRVLISSAWRNIAVSSSIGASPSVDGWAASFPPS